VFSVSDGVFSAASVEQFEYIKKEIEQSDWVVCILAGKYGSLHPEAGLSYTEMEYDYAMKIGKLIIRLIHKSPSTMLLGSANENTEELGEKLLSFRNKLTNSHLVSFWTDSNELGQELILGLLYLKDKYPTGGWVRAEK